MRMICGCFLLGPRSKLQSDKSEDTSMIKIQVEQLMDTLMVNEVICSVYYVNKM